MTVHGNTVFCQFSSGLSASESAEVDSHLLPSTTALPALPLSAGSWIDKENKKEETIRLQTRVPRIAFLRAAPVEFGVFWQWVKEALPGQEENRLQPEENKRK